MKTWKRILWIALFILCAVIFSVIGQLLEFNANTMWLMGWISATIYAMIFFEPVEWKKGKKEFDNKQLYKPNGMPIFRNPPPPPPIVTLEDRIRLRREERKCEHIWKAYTMPKYIRCAKCGESWKGGIL